MIILISNFLKDLLNDAHMSSARAENIIDRWDKLGSEDPGLVLAQSMLNAMRSPFLMEVLQKFCKSNGNLCYVFLSSRPGF